MVKARKYVVVNEFKGWPKREDFQIEEHELPPLKDGEILVKSQWLSVDPYMRLYSSSQKYDQFGYNVGVVVETKAANFPIGTKVVSHKGWCDYCILDTNKVYGETHPTGKIYKLPVMEGLPDSLAVGAVGMPGATAYFGFLEHCRPKPGDTVVVTGAAGAVGSLVGQIAKIKGCKVIGFAGSDEKVKWLESIGFDKAINYKTADNAAALKEAAPQGVNCYYDNVGGEPSSTILYQMNDDARVVVIGSISAYNEDRNKLPKVTLLQPAILHHRLSVRGYHVWESLDKFPEAFEQITKWIQSGKIVAKEHVTEGFENLFDAFGKAVVKL